MSSISCEDFADFAKVQNQEKDSKSKGNRQKPLLVGEFFKNSSEHLQEELTRIGALIQLFLKKLNLRLERTDRTF